VRQRRWHRERDEAYAAATAIRQRILGATASATNTYKFATAVLSLRHDTANAEVRQLEADSKFFRSLTVLSIGFLIASALKGESFAIVFLGITLLCCWRYIERRWKATQRAFQYIVVLNGLESGLPPNQKNATDPPVRRQLGVSGEDCK
jgi:hypothetical protein